MRPSICQLNLSYPSIASRDRHRDLKRWRVEVNLLEDRYSSDAEPSPSDQMKMLGECKEHQRKEPTSYVRDGLYIPQ